jgi:colanic acid/amylovoran biosynthesis glycosyltransferase
LFVLRAIKRLKDLGINNFELRIVGSGELEEKIKSYVTKNYLTNYVNLLGSMNYASKEMIEELKNADIFIHPSVIAPNGRKEGIPGTIIEAMVTGLPVISTYHAGIPYVIKNLETGILVKEWDISELMEKIKLLIDDVKLRDKLGKAGQKFAIENLDLVKKETELENIYNSLLK